MKEEYDIALKKKEALDGLMTTGRISQSTYDAFQKEIEDSIAETEKQQRALVAKMDSKSLELETQVKTLETLLANSEIQHVTGELDDDTYQRQSDLLAVGLEGMKQELASVRETMAQLSNGFVNAQPEGEPKPDDTIEVSKTTVEVTDEKTPIDQPVEICDIPAATENPEPSQPIEEQTCQQEQKT